MIKRILIAVLVIATVLFTALVAGLLLDSEPQATVTAPVVDNARGYLRPTREGTCWRQYIGQGDRDSIVVCH